VVREVPINVWGKHIEQKQSDVLALFGATGDLAYKMLFPALQAMVQSGRL